MASVIDGLVASNRLTGAEADRLRALSPGDLADLVSVPGDEAGLTAEGDRDTLRRDALVTAAKEGLDAARAKKPWLIQRESNKVEIRAAIAQGAFVAATMDSLVDARLNIESKIGAQSTAEALGTIRREIASSQPSEDLRLAAIDSVQKFVPRATEQAGMQQLLERTANRGVNLAETEHRNIHNEFVDNMARRIDSRLEVERGIGVLSRGEALQAIRREIRECTPNDVLRSKALSIVDKVEAQDRVAALLERTPGFAGLQPKDSWRMLMDGHLQESRGEYGFENEQGYMAGMQNGLARMLESVENHEPVSAQLFETLHDTCVNKVNRHAVHDPDAPEMNHGWMKKGYRTDDGSNVGVGFSFKPVRNDPARGRQGTLTPQGRQELDARIQADDWFRIENAGDSERLWCVTKSVDQCEQRVDRIFDDYRAENANAHTEDDKLRAIARCCQALDQSHVFEDGNIRTVSLVMNKLLLEAGLSPAILYEPNVFDGFSLGELVNEIRAGQEAFSNQHMFDVDLNN